MDIKPETVAAVKKLVSLAEKIDKAKKAIDADFKEVKQELPEAIKSRQRSMIDLHMATLEAIIDQTTDTLADADAAMEALGRVEEDEDFLAERGRREPVKKAGQQVSDANDALMGIFTEAKRLQNIGEKGRSLAKGSEEDWMRELVRLDRGIKAHRKEVKKLHQQSETIAAKARDAVQARDRKALSAAQNEMSDLALEEGGSSQKNFGAELDRIDKAIAAGKVSADVVDDLKDGIGDLRAVLKETQGLVDKMLKNKDDLLFTDIPELDVKKTLKLLELDAKFEGKLKKALESPASGRVRALDAIAKEAKLDTDGRQMEATLIKRKVIVA